MEATTDTARSSADLIDRRLSETGITVESASDSDVEETATEIVNTAETAVGRMSPVGGQVRTLRSAAAVPVEINDSVNRPSVFGSIAVTNSSEVHFGNKTVINGPVTIKQVIGNGLGLENGSYIKTEERFPRVKVNNEDRNHHRIPESERSKWIVRPQYMLLGLFGIAITASATTLVTVFLDRSQEDGYNTVTPELDPSGELLPNSRLRYVTRTEWIAQPEVEPLDKLALPARWVIIAHTATNNCSKQSECVYIVRTIQTFHIESRKWSDIGYNYLVGGDGSAYIGRGWNYVGAHTQYYNSRSIGIAFLGTFNNIDPPRRQVAACMQLIEDGVAQGKIAKDYKLFGHRQLMSTLSPGDRVYSIIQKWPHWAQNNTDG